MTPENHGELEFPAPDRATLDRVGEWLGWLRRYHRYELRGADQLPQQGGVLLLNHHSLATYDGFLMAMSLEDQTGRLPRGLGDNRIFQTPGLAELAWKIGLVPASPEAGRLLLQQGEVLGVAPGGMWEALRPSSERHGIRWGRRRGFARLSLRTQAPIVLAACPAADELFTVYRSRLTDALYRRAHLPLPIVRGWGLSLLPRPKKLVHFLSSPIHPPALIEGKEEEQAEAFAALVRSKMEALLQAHSR